METCPWCRRSEPECSCKERVLVPNLRVGAEVAEYVAGLLRAQGLPASATPLEVRSGLGDRYRFRNELDLTVGLRRVEVKSSSRAWTSLADLPFPAMMVDTVVGWERKDRKPCAVVLVSQPTRALAVVPVSSRPAWVQGTTVDRVRGITETFWKCPNRYLRPFDEFVEWLRANADRTGLGCDANE